MSLRGMSQNASKYQLSNVSELIFYQNSEKHKGVYVHDPQTDNFKGTVQQRKIKYHQNMLQSMLVIFVVKSTHLRGCPSYCRPEHNEKRLLVLRTVTLELCIVTVGCIL